MRSILDQLSTSRTSKLKPSEVEIGKPEVFQWQFIYNVYRDTDDSQFERRVVSLFEPFGDVVIKDYDDWHHSPKDADKNDSESFKKLFKKKILLFNRPRYFRTDVRVTSHFLIAVARASHPFESVLYLRKGMLAARYTTITPIDTSSIMSIYDVYGNSFNISIQIALFLDESLIKENCEQKNGNIITKETDRIRTHYLNTIVV